MLIVGCSPMLELRARADANAARIQAAHQAVLREERRQAARDLPGRRAAAAAAARAAEPRCVFIVVSGLVSHTIVENVLTDSGYLTYLLALVHGMVILMMLQPHATFMREQSSMNSTTGWSMEYNHLVGLLLLYLNV